MKNFAKVAALAAVLGAAVLPLQSQAWGGPWGGGGPWGNSGYGGGPWSGLTDMFGDMDANVSSRGWGRGSGYGYPYAGGNVRITDALLDECEGDYGWSSSAVGVED